MRKSRQSSDNTNASAILREAGNSVKGAIIAAGLSLTDVCRAAKISNPKLSGLLNGASRNWQRQVLVWAAFRLLAGSKSQATLEEFWGALLKDSRVASRESRIKEGGR